MIKKILIYTLCFILALSFCAFADETTIPEEAEAPAAQTAPAQPQQREMPQQGDMPQRGGGMGGKRPQGGPGGQRDGNMQSTETQNSNAPQLPENQADSGETTQTPQMPDMENTDRQNRFGGGMGGNFQRENPFDEQMNNQEPATANILSEYSTPIFSMILLALAFVFVTFYKRKTY